NGRNGQCGALNFSGKEGDHGLGLSTGLYHRDVPIRIETVSFQREPRCKVGERAEARRAEEFPFKIRKPSNLRSAKDREDELLDNGGHDHRVGAGKVCQHGSRAAKLNDRHLTRKHRLQGHGTARNRYRFDGEAMLLIKIRFFGKPHRHLRCPYRTTAHANLFELSFLRCARRARHKTKQRQRQEGLSLLHNNLMLQCVPQITFSTAWRFSSLTTLSARSRAAGNCCGSSTISPYPS